MLFAQVAVLVHDFPHLNYQEANEPEKPVHGKSWSITLNGSCQILDIGSRESEFLRFLIAAIDNNFSSQLFSFLMCC